MQKQFNFFKGFILDIFTTIFKSPWGTWEGLAPFLLTNFSKWSRFGPWLKSELTIAMVADQSELATTNAPVGRFVH